MHELGEKVNATKHALALTKSEFLKVDILQLSGLISTDLLHFLFRLFRPLDSS